MSIETRDRSTRHDADPAPDRAVLPGTSLEDRPIRASVPRRRKSEQARPLVPPPKPLRRFLGPLVMAGALIGALAFVTVARPAPEPPVVEQIPTVGPIAASAQGSADAPGAFQGVPVQAVAPTLAPAAPTPDPRVVNAQRLREAVFAPFRDVRGAFGIVVKELSTGQTVMLNEHIPFGSASLYKLPVMYEVLRMRDLDIFALDEELTIGPDDVAMDLGSLVWPVGTRVTIGTALERMVTLSDNSGAFMLTKKVGSGRVNDDMAALGLTQTHIRGDDLQTSAADMATLLEAIARGRAVSPATSAEMVHLMTRQQVRNRIPVKMPADAIVANKTGNWDTAAHDVAIIYGPRATIVIAFLAESIGDFDGVYDAMATSARNVYDLVNDPTFGASADPPLPRSTVSSYASPARLPNGGLSTSPQGRPTSAAPAPVAPAPAVAAPTAVPVVVPADRPRAAPTAAGPAAPVAPQPTRAPQQIVPAATATAGPAGPAIAPKPAVKPAEKPAEKPQAPPAAPAGTPALKPMAPSLFAPAPGAPRAP